MSSSFLIVFFIFGDFFVDVGNNNYIGLLVRVNYGGNGVDFFGGKVIGRFCNGWIVVDIIGKRIIVIVFFF